MADDPQPISRPPLDNEHPWPGPDYFEKHEAHYFHGRQDEALDLVRYLRRGPLTVLVGRSGVGKSSLVRAGLSEGAERERWVPIYLRLIYGAKEDRAIDQVFQALERARVAAGLDGPPRQPGETIWEYFHREGAGWFTADQCLVLPLLVFDQFEEIFALDRNNPRATEDAAEVWRQLGDLLENRVPASVVQARKSSSEFTIQRSLFKVLICIRQDYLAELMERRGQIPSVVHNHLMLSVFDGHRAVEAVLRPGSPLLAGESAREKEELAHEIVRRVWRDAQTPRVPTAPSVGTNDTAVWTSEELPLQRMRIEPALLSLFCQQLNDARIASAPAVADPAPASAPRITRELLKDQGGRIFEEFYEKSFEGIDPKSVAEATRDFIERKLIGRTAQGIDRRDSVSRALIDESMREAIRHLVDKRRLLRVTGDEDARVELIHDRLVPVVRASLERRERERKVRQDQLAWEQEREQVRKLEQDRLDQKYKELRLQAEQARTRLLLQCLGGALVALVALVLAALVLWGKTVALNQGIKDVEAGNRALTLEKLELDAQTNELSSQRRQFLGRWAANLIDQRKFIEAQHVLLWAREQHAEVPHARLLNLLIPALVAEPYGRLDQPLSSPLQVALLSSGTELLVLEESGDLQLRDLGGSRRVTLASQVSAFALGGPDERVLVVANTNSGLSVWDRREPEPRWRTVIPPEDTDASLRSGPPRPASPSGTREPGRLRNGLALSADGERFAVLYPGRGIAWTPRLLAEDPPRLHWLHLPEGGTNNAATPANESGSRNQGGGLPRVWNSSTADPDPVARESVALDDLSSVAFWNRDTELLLGSDSGTFGAFRYVLESAEVQRVPLHRGESASGVRYPMVVSADGLQAAAGEARREGSSQLSPTRRLWVLDGQEEAGAEWVLADPPQAAVTALAFSPRGDWLAAGQTDGSVDLLHRGRRVQRLGAHSGPVFAVAFSPDGRYLLSVGEPFAKLWGVEPGRERWIPNETRSRGVAFSPDGELVLQGANLKSQHSRVFRFGTHDLDWVDHPAEFSLGFLADGRRFGALLEFDEPRIVALPDRQLLFDLEPMKDQLAEPFAFSARGEWLACAGASPQVIRIWFRGTPGFEEFPLDWPIGGDETGWAAIVGSPSGNRIAVSRESGAVGVFSTSERRIIATLQCPPSASEDFEFGPGEDYLSWSDPEDQRAIVIASLDGDVVSRFASERPVARMAVHDETGRIAVEDEDGRLALLTSFSVTNRSEFVRRTAFTDKTVAQSHGFPLELVPVSGGLERSVFPAVTQLPLNRLLSDLVIAERAVAANLSRHLSRRDLGFTRDLLLADLAPFIALWGDGRRPLPLDAAARQLQRAWQALATPSTETSETNLEAQLDLALQAHPVVAATLGVELIFPRLTVPAGGARESDKPRRLIERLQEVLGPHESGEVTDWERGVFAAVARGSLTWDELGLGLQRRAIDPSLDLLFLRADPTLRLWRALRMLDDPDSGGRAVEGILGAFRDPSRAQSLYRELNRYFERTASSELPAELLLTWLGSPRTTPRERSVLLTLVNRSWRGGSEDTRLAGLREATQLDTNNASAWLGLDQLLSARGKIGETAERIGVQETLLRLRPESMENLVPRLDLGRSQSQIGRYAEALASFQTVLASTNSDAETKSAAHLAAAEVCMNLGRREEAFSSYDRAESASSRNSVSGNRVRLQRAYALMALGETNAALAAATAARSERYDIGQAYALLVLQSVARAWSTNREEIIRQAVTNIGANPEWIVSLDRSTASLRLGRLQSALGLNEAATNSWRRPPRYGERTSTARVSSARAAVLASDLAQAESLLRETNDEANPSVQLAWAELESVRVQTGDPQAEPRMWLHLSRAATGDFNAWIECVASTALAARREDPRFQELSEAMRLPAGTPRHWVELARWQCRFVTSTDLSGFPAVRWELLEHAADNLKKAGEYGLADWRAVLAEPDFAPFRDRLGRESR